MKTYNSTDVDLILEWAEKYFEMQALISCILSTDNPGPPPAPPFDNEIEYQRLRFWFRNNHNRFIQIWIDFRKSKGEDIVQTGGIIGAEFSENPFLYFYHPRNLIDLVYRMGGTSTPDIWDSDNQDAESILNAINMFSYTVMHFRYWIGEFAEEGTATDHLTI